VPRSIAGGGAALDKSGDLKLLEFDHDTREAGVVRGKA
jgi:hypothetical protein